MMILIYFFEILNSLGSDNMNWISDIFEENHLKNVVFVNIGGYLYTK